MDVIDALVKHVIGAHYAALSGHVIETAKKSILDTLGATLAGSSTVSGGKIVQLVKDWGGKGESSLIAFGGKVPALNAALANGTMARARDIDEIHLGGAGGGGGGHLSATIIPAALAIAERTNKQVSGKDFILAVTLGSDLNCRMRMAMKSYGGWKAETFAPFGVVAAGGKLMGFDEESMLNGMGIAYAQCAGNQQANVDGAMTVALQQGLGAKSGILALELAELGITGSRNVLQGKYGFYPLYTKQDCDLDVLTGELGKHFVTADSAIKKYSSCGFTHGPIQGTLELMREHSLTPADIDEILVRGNTPAYDLCFHSEAGDTKRRPRNTVDAQFSVPFTVATAAIKQNVGLTDFSDEAIKDPEILRFAQKVRMEIDPELDKIQGTIVPNDIELRTKDGRSFSMRVEFVKGHPLNPMTMQECCDKFQDCAKFSVNPLAGDTIAQVMEAIGRLEKMADVREIVELLAP